MYFLNRLKRYPLLLRVAIALAPPILHVSFAGQWQGQVHADEMILLVTLVLSGWLLPWYLANGLTALTAFHPLLMALILGQPVIHRDVVLAAGSVLVSCIVLWLFQSQVEHLKLMESLVQGFSEKAALLDSQGRIVSINAAGAEAIGYRKDDLVGRGFERLFPETEHARVRATFQRIFAGSGLQELETRIRGARGNLVAVSVRTRHVQRMGRKYVLVVAEDITDSRRMASLLASAFDAVTSPAAVIGVSGAVITCNAAFATSVGVLRDQVCGAKYLPYNLDPGLLPASWFEDLLTGKAVHAEARLPTARTVALEISPVCDDGQQLIAYAIVARDITDEEFAAKHMLQTAQLAAIGQLAAGVAHNINNILSVISVNAELLQLRAGAAEQRGLQDIVTAVDRGSAMVRKLYALAGGDSEPSLATLRVWDLFQSELEMLRPQCIQKGIAVIVDADDQLSVLAEPNLIHQVLMNLIVNGIHAMDSGGSLTLTGRAKGEWVELNVTDTGCGIPPENLERIFTPFFTTKDSFIGTGLGLPTSLSMVKAMGGDILVRSAPGKGSTFTVRLCCAPMA